MGSTTQNSVQTEIGNEQDRQPRLQNRKAVIMFFPKVMPDGKTIRIEQVFDAPVAFAAHHDMINTINAFRTEIFGDAGKLYETKNLEMPGEEVTVYVLLVNTKSGKEINRKVMSGTEAKEYLAKARAELEAQREKARQYREETTSSDFGRPIQDAMKEALNKKAASAASNS